MVFLKKRSRPLRICYKLVRNTYKDLGDGIFFQLVMCLSVWAGGLVIHAIREFPTLHGLSVLTGVMWTFGNMLSVVIIKFIGVGLGAVYWNTTGLNFF